MMMNKHLDAFTKETTAWLLKNAEHDRQWLKANGLLNHNRPSKKTKS